MSGPHILLDADVTGQELQVVQPVQGTADRGLFSRDADPAPGQYWRLNADLAEARTLRATHPTMTAGVVLLITQIETQLDGTEHAVHLAPHPLWSKRKNDFEIVVTFMYDDFLAHWSFAPDAEAVRSREIASLQEEMNETQRRMLAPPPDADIAGYLQHAPVPNAGGTGTELATKEGLRDMVAHATMTKERAERQVTWIADNNKMLSSQTRQLTGFYNERSKAMLAAANAQLKGLDKVYETVKNLTLYTGDSVLVTQVCDGAPAAPNARLTFYQDLLALDEELLIHLDDGGFDHSMVDELATVLKDPTLADRLIPAQRGFCLIQFRARDKEFFAMSEKMSPSDAFATAAANARENAISQHKRLMYRDGERFYVLTAPDVFPNIDQLLPSTGEQNDYFLRTHGFGRPRGEGADADRITADHLDFAKAQRRQLGALNDYARVLIICWGLHDRTDLFESTNIPKSTNWLDPATQRAFMELVSHDNLLGQVRESYAQYRSRMNAFLAPGMTVAIAARTHGNEDNAPGLFVKGYTIEKRAQMYFPPDYAIGIVRSAAGKMYVEVEAQYDGYNREIKRKKINAKLFVDGRDETVLVLDRLHEQDLTYFLTSRKERRSYPRYIGLYRAARAFVVERDIAEAPVRAFLHQAVIDGRVAHDRDTLDEAVTTAIAIWRSSRGYKGRVSPGDDGWSSARTALLNGLHSALSSHGERIASAQRLAEGLGRVPLRLVHKGNDSWHLYAQATPDDRDPRVPAWPWVADITLAWEKNGEASVRAVSQVLLRRKAGELRVHDWSDLDALERATSQDDMSLTATLAALDRAEYASAATEFDPERLTQEELVALAHRGVEWSRANSDRYVRRPGLFVPIGTAIAGSVKEERSYPNDATFKATEGVATALVAFVDLWGFCYRHADDANRPRILAICASTYGKRHAGEEDTKRYAESCSLHLRTIWLRDIRGEDAMTVAAAELGRPIGQAHLGNPVGKEAHIWKAAKERRTRHSYWTATEYLRVTTLGAAGARLFPELVEVCESAARVRVEA